MLRKNEKKWERRAIICFIAALISGALGGIVSGSVGWSDRLCMIPGLVLALAAVLCAVVPVVSYDE